MADMSYKLFDLVVREGNLSKAAEVAHLSPSAVSHSLKNLEKTLGVQLFFRSRDGVQLTESGRQLLPYIRAAISSEDKLEEAAFQVASIKKTECTIGVFASVGIVWISDIIRRMKEKYPELRIRIIEGYYQVLEDSLLGNMLDAAFLSLPVDPKLQFTELYQDRLLCVAPKDLKTRDPHFISIDELRKLPIIMQGRGNTRDTDRFLKEHDLTGDFSHMVWHDTMLVRLIESGLGVAIMPELILESIEGEYRAIPIEDAPYRTIGIATNSGQRKGSTKMLVRETEDYLRERYPLDLPYFR